MAEKRSRGYKDASEQPAGGSGSPTSLRQPITALRNEYSGEDRDAGSLEQAAVSPKRDACFAAGSSTSGGAAGLERRSSRPVPVEMLRSWRLLNRPSRRFEGSRPTEPSETDWPDLRPHAAFAHGGHDGQ
ncbi:hypothetical protein VTN96DRAFT_4653 [Rasamsonia emersonii]